MGNHHINVHLQTFHPLGSCFTTRLFLPPPLGKQSLDVSTYCLYLHLTTLIQTVFDRQGELLVPDLLFLQHWLDCCMNGELSETALLHPCCLLIMPTFFSFRIVCGETTVLPPNMKWQRVPFWLCGSKMSTSPPLWKGFPGGLLLITPGIDFWN